MRAKRIICVLLTLVMLMSMLPISALAAGNLPFTDVKATDWFYDAVKYVYQEDLMNGTGDAVFSPNGTTTRGMIVTILHRIEGLPLASGLEFSDVTDNQYYTDAVKWASENGIVGGYGNGKFGPNDAITRQQLATILFRYADFSGKNTILRESLGTFKDAGRVADYAVDAMQWAVAEDLIKGSDGYLSPNGFATRAQVATILERFCNVGGGILLPDFIYDQDEDNNEEEDDNSCYLIYDMVIDAAVVSNADDFTPEKVTIGESAEGPAEDPSSEVATFEGWYTSRTYEEPFDFTQTMDETKFVYAKWSIDNTDTDGEGLYDTIEQYLGTDILKEDTDLDGLNDFIEVEIGYNPKKTDSDSNGVSDFDEDADKDGLSNGREAENGTSLTTVDTDFDGLSDVDEVDTHSTNPLSADTDGDGAEDLWEVVNRFDPLTADTDFTVEIEALTPTEAEPVRAGVEIKLEGDQVKSLKMQKVSVSDNQTLTDIAGYLGSAYDFTVDGSFDEAVLSFKYDKSLGKIGPEFQPRIYYYNESTGFLEELEDQTVSDGCVSAKVNHFSTYILLNKIQFDAVWEYEIKPPVLDNEGGDATIDVVFVVDYSNSMTWNDPTQIFKQLTKDFVSKLRDDIDQAGVVKFIKTASVVSSLTTNKDALCSAIEAIKYDSGYTTHSGTDGSTGLHAALNLLSQSASDYQFVVFITDGEDNGFSYSYDSLISQAVASGIKIYAVGMGSASEATLKKIAKGTNGAYYHATTSAGAEDVLDLSTVFKEIESNTIDLTKDFNDDDIPDYYNDLICSGDLVLSTGSRQFVGIDFNYDANGQTCDDYDGDGLLNGQELVIRYLTKDERTFVYLDMVSNPLKKDSDDDGTSDYHELYAKPGDKRDPLKKEYLYDYATLDATMYNNWSEASNDIRYEEYDVVDYISLAAIGNRVKLYYSIYADYFSQYGTASLDVAEKSATKQIMVDIIQKTLPQLLEGSDLFLQGCTILKQIENADAASLSTIFNGAFSDFVKQSGKQVEVSTAKWSSKTTQVLKNGSDTKIWKSIDTLSDGLTVLGIGVDLLDIAKNYIMINANHMAFEQNMDILDEIIAHSPDKDSRKAAQNVKDACVGEYRVVIEGIGHLLEEEMTKESVKKLAEHVGGIYAKVLFAALSGADFLFGFTADMKQRFELCAYRDLACATQTLLDRVVRPYDKNVHGFYQYYLIEEDDLDLFHRYMYHIIQIQVLEEIKYCEFAATDGLIGIGKDNLDEMLEFNRDQAIDILLDRAKTFGIHVSDKLQKKVDSL